MSAARSFDEREWVAWGFANLTLPEAIRRLRAVNADRAARGDEPLGEPPFTGKRDPRDDDPPGELEGVSAAKAPESGQTTAAVANVTPTAAERCGWLIQTGHGFTPCVLPAGHDGAHTRETPATSGPELPPPSAKHVTVKKGAGSGSYERDTRAWTAKIAEKPVVLAVHVQTAGAAR